MLQRLVTWIKTHKLTALLLLVVSYFLLKGFFSSLFGITNLSNKTAYEAPGSYGAIGSPVSNFFSTQKSVSDSTYAPMGNNPVPVTSGERMVVSESNLSLEVKDVRQTSDKIIEYAQSIGGFMINSNISSPSENTSGTLVLRVPTDQFSQALEYIRGLSVKVVSEYLSGEDVTNQYTDVTARLETLNKTKTMFQEIMAKAVKIQDILEVQREILNVQSQIDQLKGQQEYLKKTSEMARITIYLSTDEFSLPYAPNNTWRADVIFKMAVRSLVADLRGVAEKLIWLGVYSVFWLPAGIIILIVFIRARKKKTPSIT